MKINYLQIEDWFILKGFKIRFDKKISVIIGENGSGKSSVLEVIALIFGHLYKYFVENKLNDDFIEGYTIDYNIKVDGRDYNVVIQSLLYQPKNEDEGVFKHVLLIDGKEYTKKEADKSFKDLGGFKAFLPNSIVLYYAGISTHIINLSNHFDKKYKDKIIKNNSLYTITPYKLPEERLFFFSRKQHLATILICAVISNNEILRNIVQKIGLNKNDIEIRFIIKKPTWAKNSDSFMFWGAAEGAIKEFLDVLSGNSYKSNYSENNVILDYVSDISIIDMLDSFIVENKELLFFKMLDILIIDDLLEGIDISWKNESGKKIEIDRLSEGEKQMILTSGLIALWSTENCLILLDEPDTFLHPKWQVEFIPRLSEILTDNQVIVTTHSPLLISSMKEGDVISMNKGKTSNFALPTYGKDSNTILLQAMNSLTRVKDIDDKFVFLEKLIFENRLEEANNTLSYLKDLLNDDSNPSLIRLSSIIKRKQIIGK